MCIHVGRSCVGKLNYVVLTLSQLSQWDDSLSSSQCGADTADWTICALSARALASIYGVKHFALDLEYKIYGEGNSAYCCGEIVPITISERKCLVASRLYIF